MCEKFTAIMNGNVGCKQIDMGKKSRTSRPVARCLPAFTGEIGYSFGVTVTARVAVWGPSVQDKRDRTLTQSDRDLDQGKE